MIIKSKSKIEQQWILNVCVMWVIILVLLCVIIKRYYYEFIKSKSKTEQEWWLRVSISDNYQK
jgi:nitrogen fixation/metabolism regulation signal transduction histidine kinase